jgi:hypothetical protein
MVEVVITEWSSGGWSSWSVVIMEVEDVIMVLGYSYLMHMADIL